MDTVCRSAFRLDSCIGYIQNSTGWNSILREKVYVLDERDRVRNIEPARLSIRLRLIGIERAGRSVAAGVH